MIKQLSLILIFLPIIFNLIIILILIFPSKINNFHPITLLIILIIITLIICLKINFLIYSWIPIILFLIIIGGLIIIFIYITSLRNNEFFNINFNFFLINLIKILPLIILIIYLIIIFNFILLNFNFESFNLFNFLNNKYYNIINILYKEIYNKTSYFIILYLYFTIICIINICYKFKAPLRQISFYE